MSKISSYTEDNCVGIYADRLSAELFGIFARIIPITCSDKEVEKVQREIRSVITRETIFRDIKGFRCSDVEKTETFPAGKRMLLSKRVDE